LISLINFGLFNKELKNVVQVVHRDVHQHTTMKRKESESDELHVTIERPEDEAAVFVLPDGSRVSSDDYYRLIVPRVVCDLYLDPLAQFLGERDLAALLLDPAHPWLVKQWGRDFKAECGADPVQYNVTDQSFAFRVGAEWHAFRVGEDVTKYLERVRQPQRYVRFSTLGTQNKPLPNPKYKHWRSWFDLSSYGPRYQALYATWIVPADELEEAINHLGSHGVLTSIASISREAPQGKSVSFENPVGQVMQSRLNSFTEGAKMEDLVTYGRGALFV